MPEREANRLDGNGDEEDRQSHGQRRGIQRQVLHGHEDEEHEAHHLHHEKDLEDHLLGTLCGQGPLPDLMDSVEVQAREDGADGHPERNGPIEQERAAQDQDPGEQAVQSLDRIQMLRTHDLYIIP